MRDWIDGSVLDAVGLAGGILVGWNSKILQHKRSIKETFSVSVELRHIPLRIYLWFISVYGPCDREAREDFFKELDGLKLEIQDP